MTRKRRAAEPRGAIRVGISGWRYPPWRGVFYPTGLRAAARARVRVAQVARRSRSTARSTRCSGPSTTRAGATRRRTTSCSASRAAASSRTCCGCAIANSALANFFASGIANLGAKLGPVLWQLPPTFRFDRGALEHFLALLPRGHRRCDGARAAARRQSCRPGACRLRHVAARCAMRSRCATRRSSMKRSSTCCGATRSRWSSPTPPADGRTRRTSRPISSMSRLHGDKELYVSGYGDDALDRWRDRLVAWSEGRTPAGARLISRSAPKTRHGRDVFCYFDNDVKVMAPRDADALARRILGAGGNLVQPQASGDDATPTPAMTKVRRSERARSSWPRAGIGSVTRKP